MCPEEHAALMRRLSRRALLGGSAMGFGALAFHMLSGNARALGSGSTALDGTRATAGYLRGTPLLGSPKARAPKRIAKNVIALYMDGGVSHLDSFDPKPRLDKEHGQPIGIEVPATQFEDVGNVLRSPWDFHPGGKSGIPVSDLFPHIRDQVDRLAIVRSMTSEFSEHTFANYLLHTGLPFQGRPSMGAWWSYGLGSESKDLPNYVVLNGGLTPPGGLDNFGSGFLPAEHQASVLRAQGELLANLAPARGEARQRRQLDLVRQLDRLGPLGNDPAVDAAIANQERAFRMQVAVPDVADISGESAAVQELYGLDSDDEHERTYARQCLLARRLVERGVRFVQLTCPDTGHDRWDQHSNLRAGHADNARAVDRPIAALLQDLAATGLLDETLVVFLTEFGRTPMAQGTDGRDHNPFGFTVWFAGAGVAGGRVIGATDDYGYYAVEDVRDIHDLHATMLHLCGVDHQHLTYRFDSRDVRLTDVHGDVIEGILA